MLFSRFFQESATPYYPDFAKLCFFEKLKTSFWVPSYSRENSYFFSHQKMKIQEKTWKLRHRTTLKHKVSKNVFNFVRLCSLWIQYFSKRKNTFYVKPFNNGPVDDDLERNEQGSPKKSDFRACSKILKFCQEVRKILRIQEKTKIKNCLFGMFSSRSYKKTEKSNFFWFCWKNQCFGES